MLIQQIQDHVGVGIPAQFNDDTGAFPVGFVPEIRNTVYFFLFMKLRDLFDQTGLVHHIRQFRYNDLALSVGQCLDIGNGADTYLSPAGAVGFLTAPGSQNNTACGEIGSGDNLKDFFHIGIPVLIHTVINDLHHRIHHLAEVVRGDISRHTNGDTGGSVYKQVRITAGQNGGFLLGFIEVGHKIYGIFIDIRQHFHRDLGKPGFRITHGGSTVTILGTEVSVTVYQRVSGGPLLGHINQSAVNGAVSVGMVFTHGIADDTGTFPMGFIRAVIQLYHGIEDSPLNRL